PNIRRTWAPKGQTPVFYHLYKQDRISSISALSVSPKRKRLALYLRFRARNLNGLDVRSFLKELLKHFRGSTVLLWDRGTIHRRKEVKRFLFEHPRIHMEYFPAYAPEIPKPSLVLHLCFGSSLGQIDSSNTHANLNRRQVYIEKNTCKSGIFA